MIESALISIAAICMELVALHGATIMLALLASRWLCSIIGIIVHADASNCSLGFNALAFVAYLAGAANYAAVGADGSFGPLSGVFFTANLILIAMDTALIVAFRWMGDRFERRIQRLAMR